MPANHQQTALEKPPQSLREVWLALAGLSAVFLFEMLDNSILNIALPTIGRDLHSSASSLQWITGAYAIVFGGLMLVFGALADRFGRRRMMLIGLVLLGLSSLSTVLVQTSGELIAIRTLMGIAAAMTTPGTIAMAFRLFEDDKLRIRAISAITAVGLVGLAGGPIVGGLLLTVAPWQVLLLINVPISILAFLGIWSGIRRDKEDDLHKVAIDVVGAILGTLTIVLTILAPTLFVDKGNRSALPWLAIVAATIMAGLFLVRERTVEHPLIDAELIRQPLVSSGLAYKAATGLATAGLGYIISLQLQLDWGWSPLRASIAMLPLVLTLLLAGFFVEKFVSRVGIHMAALFGSLCVLASLILFALFGNGAYIWVALSLILVAAGLRVVGVVAGLNVMKGTPKNRTSIGAAMVDTTDEITSGLSVAIVGTLIAAFFIGDITKGHWSVAQATQFHHATSTATWILAIVAAALIVWAYNRASNTEAI